MINKELFKIILIVLFFFFVINFNIAGTAEDTIKQPLDNINRKVKNEAFGTGEKLTFAIKWGPIVAGYATLEVTDIIDLGSHKAYEIVSEAKSTSFFDIFYKVRDVVKSYIDCEGMYSWRFERDISEGKYHTRELILYDQQEHFADIGGKVVEIPPYVQDILSALYYVRTHELKVGQEIKMPVNASDKNYELIVKILEKTEIKVPKGKFNTILVEPLVKYEGLFQHKGRLLVWLTDDKRKIPVLMRSKIAVGSIDAELIELKLP